MIKKKKRKKKKKKRKRKKKRDKTAVEKRVEGRVESAGRPSETHKSLVNRKPPFLFCSILDQTHIVGA
jgi:hypothetical protein